MTPAANLRLQPTTAAPPPRDWMANTPINAPIGSAIPDKVASPTDFSPSTPDRINGVTVAMPSGMF
ncbi:MAG TPA: hypothetical protein VMW03_06550 [Candidatus Krumholzibacteriaceae bacterium]|nr:hypothetical protein [Candidatus Krumholzibacteriaceae bacterium]